MKRELHITIRIAAASMLAVSALAQEAPDLKTGGPDSGPLAGRTNQLSDAAKVSDVIGTAVENDIDEKLGHVKDLAVDVKSGRIVLVIMSTGGFIGIGERLTAVPPESLHYDVDYKVFRIPDTDKEEMQGAPEFEMSKWPECCNSNYLSAVYGYYAEHSAFRFIQKGNAAPHGRPGLDRSLNTASRGKADGTRNKNRSLGASESMIPASRLMHIQKSSQLMGMSVKNLQNEELGKVENILVDISAGRIVALVVSSGAFLGLDHELSPVPPTALRFSPDWHTLQLDASRDMLSHAPHFKAKQWPDFSHSAYADVVYRAYRLEPYFATNESSAQVNTARILRRPDDRTLAPLDQGGSQADENTSARIRTAIIAVNDMSADARNVKIITRDGRVTLLGPVNTAEEKSHIFQIAEQIARPGNVDNQLVAKLTASNNN